MPLRDYVLACVLGIALAAGLFYGLSDSRGDVPALTAFTN